MLRFSWTVRAKVLLIEREHSNAPWKVGNSPPWKTRLEALEDYVPHLQDIPSCAKSKYTNQSNEI